MKTARSLVLAAEVGLGLVSLAAVLGMARLFAGGGWLTTLAVNAVAAHVLVAAVRRRGASLVVSAAASALAALLVMAWTSYWSTTAVGIPTGATWSAMGDDLGSAWTLYQDVVAPAPVEPGFLLASALAVWCIAYIADWAAFRLWVPFEATLPAGTLFLFTSLLGTERGRGWAVAAFAGSVLVFMLLHRLARQDGSSHWVAERRALGHRSLLGAGAALSVVAVVAGTVLGPAMPGADSAGVLDPRSLRDRDSSRLTISPLVDIRSRLVDQRNIEVFQVRSPQPSYWRLTSLERFDGRIWSSSGSFGRAGGDLPSAVDADVASQSFEQSFTISALAAIWLPSAYEPRALVADGVEVRYDEQSATLIVDNDIPTSDGLVYQVTSESPRLEGIDLGAGGEVPDDVRDRYLSLPDDFSPRVRELANQVTAATTSPYEQARALQDHLRTFQYDLGIGPGHSQNALESFLFDIQRGYCEQFAGAFAAMARAVGLPARVAVGFTQGEVDPADPTLYRVRGEHAHAWPEVHLAGAGWVAFEPTPGRGMPFAESYTGVTPSQAATNDPGVATTSPPTTGSTPIPSAPEGLESPRNPDGNLDTGAGGDDAAAAPEQDGAAVRYLWRPLLLVVPILLGLVLAYLLIVPLALHARRRWRRRQAGTPEQRIDLAWTESVEDAAVVGYRERASDTHRERAAMLATSLPGAAEAAGRLAGLLDAARYSAAGTGDDEADEAVDAASRIGREARAVAGWKARVLRWLDLRSMFGAWRTTRAAAHRRITTTARADLEVERGLMT